MSVPPYFSPSEQYYRGEISRDEARRTVLANATRTRKVTGSPTLNRILKVAGMLAIPFVFIAHCLASKRN